MFTVLDRYIGRTILNTILLTLFLLVGLSGVVKFVEQLRAVGEGKYSLLGAAAYTLLSVPSDIELFFPMAALLGALLGLGTLAARSELVVMQASGFTKLQIALSVMKTAIPLALLAMAIGEWVAPPGDQTARNMKTEMISGGSLLANQGGIWAKDGNDFIFIQQVQDNGEQTELSGVNIYHFDNEYRLLSVRYAASARFDNKLHLWDLSQVETADLSDNKKIGGSQSLVGVWKTSLTPDKLGVVVIKPDALSISSLYNYIHYLKSTGQETKNYQLSFWKKVCSPLALVVMMLLALSFIFGPLRSVAMGLRIVIGVIAGFTFFMLNQVIGNLSLISDFSPLLSVMTPSLLFLLLSIYLLRRRS
ncbi:MAG: LPS export ABC transporter permease LptG [Enterobacteriaceae bacterium]